MAYDRCRLSLCGAGWKPLVVKGQMIGLQKRPEEEGVVWRVAGVEEVRDWLLLEKNFEATPLWYLLQRGEVLSSFGVTPEVELAMGRWGVEVIEVLLTFTLTPESEYSWAGWSRLVGDLCRRFGLQVVDPEGWRVVSAEDVLAVMSRTSEWRWYAGAFGWGAVC